MSDEKLSAKALKAQRRAEKVAAKTSDQGPPEVIKGPPIVEKQTTRKQSNAAHNNTPKGEVKKTENATVPEVKPVAKPRTVALFSHLEQKVILSSEHVPRDIHPAVISFALQCSRGLIIGSNSRCIAMLRAFQRVIRDYSVPQNLQTSLQRHLPTYLSAQISYLVTARPLSVSMGSAIRLLKQQISKTDIEASDDTNKERLIVFIDTFIRERIEIAGQVIVKSAQDRIVDGDVILVYAHSTIVEAILLAASATVLFKVIVVDSRPKFEGRRLVQRLSKAGVPCTYVMLTAIGHVMGSVDKVLLGAHTVLANGAVYSRAGTALVAMTASENHVPVVVACETYKFSDRVQLDSFVTNELGPTSELDITLPEHTPAEATIKTVDATKSSNTTKAGHSKEGSKESSRNDKSTHSGINEKSSNAKTGSQVMKLNLLFDVTPGKYITLCVSELGSLPTTAIPFAALSEQDNV